MVSEIRTYYYYIEISDNKFHTSRAPIVTAMQRRQPRSWIGPNPPCAGRCCTGLQFFILAIVTTQIAN